MTAKIIAVKLLTGEIRLKIRKASVHWSFRCSAISMAAITSPLLVIKP